MKRLTFDIDENLFYDLKVHCVKSKKSIKDFLTTIIKENINKK